MQKLMVFVATLLMMLATACSPASAIAEPSSAPTAPPISVEENDDSNDTTSEDVEATQDEDIEELFRLLEQFSPYFHGGTNNGMDCNPLSSWCLYDPFYGSCQWDAWRGVYICDSYHYRPGYDCSYDWWYGEYVCRPHDDYGWGW